MDERNLGGRPPMPEADRARIEALLLDNWKPDDIKGETGYGLSKIYEIRRNMKKPRRKK